MTNLLAPANRPGMEDTQVAAVNPDEGQAPMAAKAPKAPKVSLAPGGANGRLGAIFNVLTLLFVLLTCLSAGGVAAVFQSTSVLRFVPGGSAFILAAEPSIAQVLSTPTLPAGTPSPEPSSTKPLPTYTSTSTATPTRTTTKPSPAPTKTGPTPRPTIARSAFAYTMQNGSPTAGSNYVTQAGCNWLGIVGNAYGLDGNPLIGLTVHVEESGGINWDAVTGTGPKAFAQGYMIQLLDHFRETTDVYRIQLRNNTGTPLSDTFSLHTYGDCNKNLLRVDFVHND